MYKLEICRDYVIDTISKFYGMPKNEVNDMFMLTKSIDETMRACDMCLRLGHRTLEYAREVIKNNKSL